MAPIPPPEHYQVGHYSKPIERDLEDAYHDICDFIYQIESKLNSQERQDLLDIRDKIYRLLR